MMKKSSFQVVLEPVVRSEAFQEGLIGKVAETHSIDYVAIRNSISRLRCEEYKLDQTSTRLRKKDRILFDRAMSAIKANNKKVASRYATKISETRKTIRFLYEVEMGIERFVMQLEAKLEIGDTDNTQKLKSSFLSLRNMLKEFSKILPDVSTVLENVCDEVEGNRFIFGIRHEDKAFLGDYQEPRSG
jgi:hypothetical protein